jgi:hypothetical protein
MWAAAHHQLVDRLSTNNTRERLFDPSASCCGLRGAIDYDGPRLFVAGVCMHIEEVRLRHISSMIAVARAHPVEWVWGCQCAGASIP